MENRLADVSRRYFPSPDFSPSPEGGQEAPKPGDARNHLLQGLRISRPNTLESFIPVVGPAWEAAADLQDGDIGGAAFNGAMAVVDVFPAGVAVKGLRAASKGIGVWKKGSLTANAARNYYRSKIPLKDGYQLHHVFPLDGISRSAPNWRNHFALLKPLPKEVHKRLHGRSGTLPKYGRPGKLWHGTTDWMKAAAIGVPSYAGDSFQNLHDSSKAGSSRFSSGQQVSARYPDDEE